MASFVFIFKEEHNSISFLTLNTLNLFSSVFTLIIAFIIYKKEFKPAKYFLIAWSILLLSIIQFNLSNLDFILYFIFTDHSLEIGSVIEIVLLSLRLAYGVNVLKLEKETSQVRALSLIKKRNH